MIVLRLALLSLVLLHLPAVVSTSQAQDLPLPQEWSTHYAWFLVANPEYVSGTPEEEQDLTNKHIQYQLRLVKEKDAIVAGGLGTIEGDSTVGLTILRAGSKEAALELASEDPTVRAGRLLAIVREWWVPSEQLR